LERGMRAVKRDEKHRGKRCGFHGDPHYAKVVGRQHEQHREAEQLVHAVVEAHPGACYPPVIAFDAHVRPRKKRRRHRDEGGERHEKDVERVHEQLLTQRNQRAAFDDARHQHGGGGEAEAAEHGVYFRSARPVPDEGKNRASSERRQQKGEELDRHQCSLSFSRCRVSTESKRSRISKMKMPRISAATSTSSAMPSSTTIGMPYTEAVAAKNRPFSMERKPITCGTALERVIIIRKESSTLARAMPRVARVTVPASSE